MQDPKDPDDKTELPPTVAWDPEDIPDRDEAEEYPTDPKDPLIGTLLRGKWRVLERIGAGSFGTVYKVRDEKGGWIEALKILGVNRLTGVDGEATQARFLREAQIMKRLGTKSPHIVGLSTYEEDLEAGLVYFLMEHVEGRDLAQVLDSDGPFSAERAINIALQVCEALIVAHESSEPVVHRDLKLQNLMLTEGDDGGEHLMVLDFGIAKIAEADPDSRLTKSGSLGTPGYAAPEQLRAEPVDGRTDLFALGVVLYALLTGKDPWLGKVAYQPTDQIYRLMAATDRGEVRPIEETGRRVPKVMARVVMKLLRRDPAERFQSARELRDHLIEIREGASALDAEAPTSATTGSVGATSPSTGSGAPERRLAAVWFADLVGYSSLSSTDEGAALALLDTFHTTARETIEAGGGRLVQFIGDAAFAEFSSTDKAVRTAMRFHDEFASATVDADPKPQLRTGVHVGDVLMSPTGDLFGDGVNVASRIQNEAEPGQIIVSQDVWRQLKQRRDFEFESIGERTLKGLGAPVWLFAVAEPKATEDGEKASATTGPTTTPAAKRNRFAHVAGIAAAYVTVSVVMLFASRFLSERFDLAPWVTPAAGALLAIGLLVILVTAWVQSRPTWERSVGERGAWSLDLADVVRTLASGRLPELTWARAAAGGVFAFTGLLALSAVFAVGSDDASPGAPGGTPMAQPAPAIAILPFATQGAPEVLSQGIADLMGLSIDGSGGVRVADALAVRRSMGSSALGDAEAAMQVARSLGNRYAVAGTVVEGGSELTLDVGLYDVRTGQRVSQASVSGVDGELGDLVTRMTAALFSGDFLPSDARATPVSDVTTESGPALAAFLEGEQRLRQADWPGAISAFTQASELDPSFALASSRLAFARGLAVAPQTPSVDPAAERALEGVDALPEREQWLLEGIVLRNRGSSEAIEIFERMTSAYPEDPDGWYLLGEALYHLQGVQNGPRLRQVLERAIDLAGNYEPAYSYLVATTLTQGDTTEARRIVSELRGRNPASLLLAELDDAVAGTPSVPTRRASDTQPAVSSRTETTPRPQPTQTDDAQPREDPLAGARSAYQAEERTAGSSRSRAQQAAHPALRSRLAEVESLWTRARNAASEERFSAAMDDLRLARSGFEGVIEDSQTMDLYDSRVSALAGLRSAAVNATLQSEAQRLERDAERAVAERRYADALRLVGQARDSWERAGQPPSNPTAGASEPVSDPSPPPASVAADVLGDLASAISSEDIDRVRSIWTSISSQEAEGLRALFSSVRDLRVDYEVRSVQERGSRIVVEVSTTYTFYAEQARDTVSSETDQVFELEERSGAWVVVASR